MEEGVNIRDVHSLEEMNNMVAFTGEAMANIEENVSNYIDGVKSVLDQQLEIIRKKLEEAEQELAEAEADLSSCEASQSYDEESGEYRPSCSSEERAVNRARREVEKWQKKYDEGKSIVDECASEIDDYNSPGSILYPPGGHYLIQNMSAEQTPKIGAQLREYIGEAYDVLTQDVGGDPSEVQGITNPNVSEDDVPRSQDDKFAKFRANLQAQKEEQASESARYEIKDANRAMRCPTCGRPLQLCICKNLHADAVIFEN